MKCASRRCLFIFLLSMCALAHAGGRDNSAEKFALLVGVDDQIQPASYRVSVLKGPGNDVKLMRKLLIERYGFSNDERHIRTLTGKNATKVAIQHAFESHLIQNATTHPGATVLFYFSGHGSTAADVNNDESDGIDETLVAYDSRGPGGEDIVDDEIDAWFERLRAHTSNATFVLDSCHSQTATRGNQTARSLPPQTPTPSGVRGPSNPNPELLRNEQYVAASASLASELSFEGEVPGEPGKTQGYFTWALYQILNLQPSRSWHETISDVRRLVGSLAPQQHPQVEGDVDRLVLGSAKDREQPHLSIVTVNRNSTLIVNGGEPQGLSNGTILAIFDPSASALVGDTKKLATAIVTNAGVAQSEAAFLDKPKATLPRHSKVAVVTPYFGVRPLHVKLDTLPDQATSPSDRLMLAHVRKALTGNALVKAVADREPWSYSIQRGCFTDHVVATYGGQKNCTQVYYLASRQLMQPALSFWAFPSDPDVAVKISDAISALGRQSALRLLSNQTSSLDVSFLLEPITLTTNGAGNTEIQAAPTVPPSEQAHLSFGSAFRFDIRNHSSVDVWVVIVAIETSGAIKVLTPTKTGDRIPPGGAYKFYPPLIAHPPAGVETFKLIATTSPDVDFSVLAAPGVLTKGASSQLNWFLAQVTSVNARDTSAAEGVALSEWTTSQLDVVFHDAEASR